VPKKTVLVILFLLWVLCVTALSLLSLPDLDAGGVEVPYSDKIVHFIFYFGFVWLGGLALYAHVRSPYPIKKMLFWVFLAAVFYGTVIEVLQHVATAYRSAEWSDFMANTFGALTAALLLNRYLSGRHRLN
tara:strand:- start:1046 stop:1438 length:393 start_codon:yes stop_codon:yes gene_type:complete